MKDRLEVWIDAAQIGPACRVGWLHHDRGQLRFHYEREWLRHPASFAIDPDLSLDAAPFFPRPEAGNFGVFLDSAPDRWGQTLMKRREALEAKAAGRPPRTLYTWDYLIGVQDETRVGALRFRRPDGEFVSQHPLAAPPVAHLRELEAVAHAITAKRIDDLDALRRWLGVLLAPGASLGGARPKASFRDNDGSLWIAKFPARDDDYDIGAWEWVVHRLASDAGIDVPPARLLTLTGSYRSYAVRRFDRAADRRICYASAMTMLRRDQSEGCSYLDLAEFLRTQGDRAQMAHDLRQLFRRVLFNICVGNRDDHLRNHGFLLSPSGWRLAPAFDVNPSLDKSTHVLDIDYGDNRPSLSSAVETAEWYGVKAKQAEEILIEVRAVVRRWREVARGAGLSEAEVAYMEGAFAEAG